MAENLIENRVCNSCGAEMRPNTLFCYNCGSSLDPETVVTAKDKKRSVAKKLRENAVGEETANNAVQPAANEAGDKPIPKPALQEEPKLQSAAALRRKPKIYQPKTTEVIWDENSNAPNGWFILAAILLALFAAGILYLASYLK